MEYTNRVQLGEDGLYRWYYDLDMRKNRYMLNMVFKVLGIIGAFLLALVLFLPSGAMSKWTVAGIILGCYVFVALLTIGIYWFMLVRREGFYRFRYDMGPEGVMLWQEEGDMERNQILGAAVAAAGAAAGHPIRAAVSSASIQAGSYSGYTAYKSVRKVVVDQDKDCVYLKLFLGENLVYVGQEDFDFVRDYILSRVGKKAAAG